MNNVLENLRDAHVVIVRSESDPLWRNIEDVLRKYGARISYFIPWDSTSSPIREDAFVVAPSWFQLSENMIAGRILYWKRWPEWTGIDLYDTSPNEVAQRIAELLQVTQP